MDAVLNLFGLNIPPEGFEIFLYVVKAAFGIVCLNEVFKMITALLCSIANFR